LGGDPCHSPFVCQCKLGDRRSALVVPIPFFNQKNESSDAYQVDGRVITDVAGTGGAHKRVTEQLKEWERSHSTPPTIEFVHFNGWKIGRLFLSASISDSVVIVQPRAASSPDLSRLLAGSVPKLRARPGISRLFPWIPQIMVQSSAALSRPPLSPVSPTARPRPFPATLARRSAITAPPPLSSLPCRTLVVRAGSIQFPHRGKI
jgi:hypothetical protein